jgi:VTC domain
VTGGARHRGEPLDVSALAPVDLAEVVEGAAQLTRVDRKYLVPREVAQALVAGVADTHRVLSIGGRTWTTYRSTYFDTDDLAAARAHVQRRRRRWKARSRLYVEDDLCRIEVKTKDGLDSTVKVIAPSDPARYGQLEGAEARFVSEALARHGVPVDVADLNPSVEVTYRRTTLADTAGSTRVTVDSDVESVLNGSCVWLDPEHVLVETKGHLRPSAADRFLVSVGARPRSFSKYASAAALLRPDIPDNDVRALCGRQLHCAPLLLPTEVA